jgi:protein involved in polysaccharide export with SLBB domain
MLIPGIGELDLADRTLHQAQEFVRERVASRFRNVEVTLTLTRLRRFKVPFTGQLARPGIATVTALDRVSQHVARAGGVKEGGSLRQITVRNGGRERTKADLLRFFVLGDIDANPRLQVGDQVQVPYAGDLVYAYGAVNAPGQYEYVRGDRISDLLAFAGGFQADAVVDTIEVARYGAGDHVTRHLLVRVARPGENDRFLPVGAVRDTIDWPLEPSDRIFVWRRGGWREREVVTVAGEVRFPGTYPIVEGVTRVREIIERAGGPTPDASLLEATLVRSATTELPDREFERLKGVSPADMTEDEYEYFKMRSREKPGVMVIDFEKLINEGSEEQNIFLMDGDRIEVPKHKDYVSVLGMVARPGNVEYRAELSAKDYIRLAGGYADRAAKGKTRVIRVASGEWQKPGDVDQIHAGDTVWVPEKPDRDWWKFFRDGLLVATQIATLYLVADRAVN